MDFDPEMPTALRGELADFSVSVPIVTLCSD